MIRFIRIWELVIAVIATLASAGLSAQEMHPRSNPVVDESDATGRPRLRQLPGLNVVEIVRRTMAETSQKVSELLDDSVIIYSAMFSDGKGTFYPPATALSLIAEKANRPIMVAAETFLAPGGLGGVVLAPEFDRQGCGKNRAPHPWRRVAVRIAATKGGVKPIFNRRQVQRWNVAESSLPAGSEIRFREPGLCEKHRWQSVAGLAILLVHPGLIIILLHERRKRRHAEVETRHRRSELAHVNRSATAGELSSSIAHELNQPLGRS